MKFETLKEQRAMRNLEDFETDYGEFLILFLTWTEDLVNLEEIADVIPYEEVDPTAYDSDLMETDDIVNDNDEDQEETVNADLAGAWGRIIFPPVQRGWQIHMNICQPYQSRCLRGFI